MDIRHLRDQHKLSRNKFAEMTGIKPGRVWALENGKEPTEDEVTRMAWALHPDRLDPETRDITEPEPPVPSHPSEFDLSDIPDIEPAVVSEPSAPSEPSSIGPLQIPAAGGGPVRQEGVRLVSNSEIQTFKRCRRKWWLGWYRGLTLHEESPFGPRAIGNRLHNALKMYYVPDGFEPMDPRQALERLITEDWSALTTNGFSEEFQKKFDAQANLERAIIEGYVQWVEEEGEDSDLQVIAPETYLEATIIDKTELHGSDVEVRFIGKLDVRAFRKHDGVRQFIDHKSVQSFDDKVRMLPLDEQMLGYHLLEFLNTEESDERCDGALYNMLRKVKRGVTSKPPYYKRVPVAHNLHEIESYRRRTVGTIETMLDVEDALNNGANHLDVAYPTPKERDCTWSCDFVAVCPMFDDGSRADALLENYYRQHDPLEYYGITQGEDA